MSRRRFVDAVVPVVHFAVSVERLGAVCAIDVLAEHAGPVEDGLLVLDELHRSWGADGALDAIRDALVGRSVQVSWETLLLLGTMMRGPGEAGVVDLDLDVPRGTATRTGPSRPPTSDEMHTVAADLVAQELQDAGCLAARVSVGGATVIVNEHEWRSFRRADPITG